MIQKKTQMIGMKIFKVGLLNSMRVKVLGSINDGHSKNAYNFVIFLPFSMKFFLTLEMIMGNPNMTFFLPENQFFISKMSCF